MPAKIIDPIVLLSGMMGIAHQIKFSGFSVFNGLLTVIGSLVFIIYFASMLYHKIVKIHYNGSWKKYFWSIKKHLRK